MGTLAVDVRIRLERVQIDRSGMDIDPIHVHQLAIAEVHSEQHPVREFRVRSDKFRAHALPRCKVADVTAREIDGEANQKEAERRMSKWLKP